MYYYKIYGAVMESEIEYPQLLPSNGNNADFSVKITEIERNPDIKHECYVEAGDKTQVIFANQVGILRISNGTLIEVCSNPGVELEKTAPFVLGYGLSILFFQRGKTAIHCSAVNVNGKAVLIAGNSGAGKSSLTMRFVENGYKLMADDVAMIDGTDELMVYPAFPIQKLCRDAVKRNNLDIDELTYIDEDRDKFALSRREEFYEDPAPFGLLVYLVPYDGNIVKAEEMEGVNRLMTLISNLFLYLFFKISSGLPENEMKRYIEMSRNMKMVRLYRPRTGDSTKEQMEEVLKYINS